MLHMATIGVRELRQNASAVLRRVAGGEIVEITQRGRPVARLVPLGAGGGLDQLAAEGRVIPAAGDLLSLDPITPAPGARPLSAVLAEMRADER